MDIVVKYVLQIVAMIATGIFCQVLVYTNVVSPFFGGEWRDVWEDHGWNWKVYMIVIFFGINYMNTYLLYRIVKKVAEKVSVLIDIYFLLT